MPLTTPITAADLLNDKVLPFYEKHQLPLLRILTDRGTEYCGKAEIHDYQLYLAISDIEHTKYQGQITSNQRNLRTFSQNHAAGILSGDLQKENLSGY